MIGINEIHKGDTIFLIEHGISTTGTILQIDQDTQTFVYETEEGEQDTIKLQAAENSKVPGNVYDVHRHQNTGVIVANFKSWQSGKYYEC